MEIFSEFEWMDVILFVSDSRYEMALKVSCGDNRDRKGVYHFHAIIRFQNIFL